MIVSWRSFLALSWIGAFYFLIIILIFSVIVYVIAMSLTTG